MPWKIRLSYANGQYEDLYATTRDEARSTARFYRLWTTDDSGKGWNVVGTRVFQYR